jgi:hypothetical protein
MSAWKVLPIASPANDCRVRVSIATPRRGIQEGGALDVDGLVIKCAGGGGDTAVWFCDLGGLGTGTGVEVEADADAEVDSDVDFAITGEETFLLDELEGDCCLLPLCFLTDPLGFAFFGVTFFCLNSTSFPNEILRTAESPA